VPGLARKLRIFCTAEFAGGPVYDQGMKKWKGAAFRADMKFVLRLKVPNSRVEKSFLGKDETVYDYTLNMTMAGSNLAIPCIGLGQTTLQFTAITGCEARRSIRSRR
jgi:hypothetical protein